MNATSAEVGPEVDEFELAGLTPVSAERVDAPYVEGCPAVLECVADQEVAFRGSKNTLVIGEVVGVRLGPELAFEGDTMVVDFQALRAVGRLSGSGYLLPERVRSLPRP